MGRRLIVPLALLALLGVVLFPFLRSAPAEAPKGAPARPFEWANRLALDDPPPSAYRSEVMNDPVERAVSRLTWGAVPDVVYWTQKHLPEDRDRLVRRILEELDTVAEASPFTAQRLVETLGMIGSEACTEPLLRYAQRDPDYLQVSALRALANCPWNEEVKEVVAALSASSNAQVAAAARRAVVQRPDFWSPETFVELLGGMQGSDLDVLLDEAGKRGLAFAADAVARHLDSADLTTRQVAMRTLLTFGDPRGMAAAVEELRVPSEKRVYLALTIFRDARVPPPLDDARRLAEHADGDVRNALAQSLGPGAGESDEQSREYLRLLRGLADTDDPVVRMTAIGKLHERGQFEQLQEYREILRDSHGDALKEAVRFLCETIRDRAAAPILRRRMDEPMPPEDMAHLLFGLRFVGDAADVPVFTSFLLRAGTDEDRRGSSQTYLSEHASLYVQSLGAAAVPGLLEALDEATTTEARLLALDALRGIGRAAGPAAADALLALVDDSDLPEAVRRGAAETLPFLEDLSLGPRLREVGSRVESHELGSHLRKIFLCYF